MKFNFLHINIAEGLSQIPEAFKILLSTPDFIKKHQLWKGFWSHSWVLVFSIITACAFSFILFNNVHDYFTDSEEDVEINISTEAIDEGIEDMEEAESDSPDEAQLELEAGKESLTKVKESLEGEQKSLFSGSLGNSHE